MIKRFDKDFIGKFSGFVEYGRGAEEASDGVVGVGDERQQKVAEVLRGNRTEAAVLSAARVVGIGELVLEELEQRAQLCVCVYVCVCVSVCVCVCV